MVLLNGLDHCVSSDSGPGGEYVGAPGNAYMSNRPKRAHRLVFEQLVLRMVLVLLGATWVSSVRAQAAEPQAAKLQAASAQASAAKPSSVAVTSPDSSKNNKPPPGVRTSVAGSPAQFQAGAGKAGSAQISAVKAPISGNSYAVKLRELESRVDELKEQIRRSHTRLSLLSDSILAEGVGGARAVVRFKNDLSGAFRLTRALFVLDGAVQYNKQDDTGGLAEQKEIPIFKGSIPPGDHTLQILLKLQGHGYGVFSYLRGYQFEVKESHSFSVTEGKEVELDVILWEKGGVTTPLEERPAIRHLERLRNVTGPVAPAAATESSGASSTEK